MARARAFAHTGSAAAARREEIAGGGRFHRLDQHRRTRVTGRKRGGWQIARADAHLSGQETAGPRSRQPLRPRRGTLGRITFDHAERSGTPLRRPAPPVPRRGRQGWTAAARWPSAPGTKERTTDGQLEGPPRGRRTTRGKAGAAGTHHADPAAGGPGDGW